MKKVVFLLIIAIIFNSYSISYGEENLLLNGEASILIDYDTKEILYEKNKDMQLYPASTTKIMTAILALELGNLDDIVTIDQEIVNLTKGSHIALEPGEELTLEQLLYALMVPSANDAALAIGKHIAGSIEGFIELMNAKAKEIGAINTNYVNPNGLHDDRHLSTAYDLAMIGQYAMQNEMFRKLTNTVTYQIEPTNKKTETRYFKVTNKLLFSSESIDLNGNKIPAKYEGASGVKTGYTPQAQSCLVSFAEKDGQRLLAVVLKSSGNYVYSDSHKLLNYGFENYTNSAICNENEFIENVRVENGLQEYVAGVIDKSIIFPLSVDKLEKIERKVVFKEGIEAPIFKGDLLGETQYYLDGNPIGTANIISTMDIELDPMTKTSNKILSKWYWVLFGFIILLRIFILTNRKKRRRRSKRSMYRVPYGLK